MSTGFREKSSEEEKNTEWRLDVPKVHHLLTPLHKTRVSLIPKIHPRHHL